MFKNLFFPLFSVILFSNSACFTPQKYFADVPMESGESVKFSVPDSVLLELSRQILLVHDFKLAAPLRDSIGNIVLIGEKLSTELLRQRPLSDGAVRIRILQMDSQESRIWFAWHSFYRKNLKSRIREDEKANTGRFWELLTMRVHGL